MESDLILQMLSSRNASGGNYFHEACQAGSLALLLRAAEWMNRPIPSILTVRDYDGEQCTHIIVKNKDFCTKEMMEIVLNLGADINGQEWLGGSTPLHLCVWERNYELAEWLCRAPDFSSFVGFAIDRFLKSQIAVVFFMQFWGNIA
ncbi:hypothetical protein G9C98_003577 [Cotesia typhae]|uniref:Uncharacterized protein n=1 Tax=Cotesia typhae TaxID=2053667 RepID=A0A8J5UVE3_9HYME|nr:hypothetical protein G9C98_003577 [Cotesia typhae]